MIEYLAKEYLQYRAHDDMAAVSWWMVNEEMMFLYGYLIGIGSMALHFFLVEVSVLGLSKDPTGVAGRETPIVESGLGPRSDRDGLPHCLAMYTYSGRPYHPALVELGLLLWSEGRTCSP